MQTVRYGGLTGKARRARRRSRTARLYAQQMIDEYFAGGCATPTQQRYIPIGSRNEFLPSIADAGDAVPAATGTQGEGSFGAGGRGGRSGRRTGGRRAESRREAAGAAESAIRFPPSDKQDVRFDPRKLKPARRGKGGSSGRFTLGGFLVGCAMGSAAAAIVLLVVQVAVG